jgi:acetyltransferase
VLATDALLTTGGALADVSKQTMEELNKFLPPVWSHNNPIDVIGDAGPELYAKTLEAAGRDPNSDGLLVILTPQAMTDATATAEKLKAFGHIGGKPVLASWMGGNEVAPARQFSIERAFRPSPIRILPPGYLHRCSSTMRICARCTKLHCLLLTRPIANQGGPKLMR